MNLDRDALNLRLWAICLVLSLLIPTCALAQTVMVGDVEIDPRDFAPDQDPETRLAPCLACHGAQAGGDIDFGPEVQFGTPALRGMAHDYLKESLIDYQAGRRSHEEMTVIASMLEVETIDFMARSFAAYPAPPLKSAEALARLADEDPRFRKGQAIALEGLPDEGVPACATCHGDLGEGNAELGPRLAGQNGLYIRRQFTAYADGTRQTAQAEIMQPVAAELSQEDIAAVAHYYEQLIQVGDPKAAPPSGDLDRTGDE